MILSLELRWIARHDKDLLLPEIVFAPTNEDFNGRRCGGCYYRPERAECLYGDRFVPFDRGVIVVGTKDPELIPGTIAHEWRHHWQLHRGLLGVSKYDPAKFTSHATYDSAIRTYFRTQRHELDALLFQYKHAPDQCSENSMALTFGQGKFDPLSVPKA